MTDFFQIMGVKCANEAPLYHIKDVEIGESSEKLENDEHFQVIEMSNIFAIRHVPAMYLSNMGVSHTTISIPTTENTGRYLVLGEGYDPKTSTFDTTSIPDTDAILVVMDVGKVDRIDQINRGMIEGIAYIDENSIKEMVRALDM